MAATRNDKGKFYILGFIGISLVVVLMLIVLGFSGKPSKNDEIEKGPWKDLKGFKRTASNIDGIYYREAVSPLDLQAILDPADTLYVLMGIQSEITGEELIAIREFLIAGGKVIVADDGMLGNELGDIPFIGNGGHLTFVGHRYLVQGLTGEKDPGFVVNRSFVRSAANFGGTTLDLIVHEPNGLNYTGGGDVILKTTKVLTVIDLNDNYVQELSDTYSPYGPIAVEFHVGTNGGSIVYFSTTGIFTDNIFKLEDNDDFTRIYLQVLLPEGGDVILDQSKETSSNSPHNTVLPQG